MSLKSSTETVGEVVTEIIHFSWWNKRTFKGIITSTIIDWTFTKMMLEDWRMLMVNWNNVDCIEVFRSDI
jgi:hypothetical protein